MAIGLYCWRTERSDIEARECRSGAVTNAEAKAERKKHRSNDWQEEDVEHAALAADAPQQAPDTDGASGSADVPTYMLPNVQAARLWNQASSVGHTA